MTSTLSHLLLQAADAALLFGSVMRGDVVQAMVEERVQKPFNHARPVGRRLADARRGEDREDFAVVDQIEKGNVRRGRCGRD